MSRYLSKKPSDHGDFAISFADLVFGLLFVFFLLAIAMVFNRPEVDAFQKKLDEMQRALDEQAQVIREAGSRLEKSRKQIERLKSRGSKAKEKPETPVVKMPRDMGENEKREQNRVQAKLDRLQRDYHALEKKAAALKKKERLKRSRLSNKLARLLRDNKKLKRDLARLRVRNKIAVRHNKEVQAILNKVKQILRRKGLADILAEVDKMEKTLKESERKAQSGEDSISNDYKLWVAYDPQKDSLSAELWQGERLLDDSFSTDTEELLAIAKALNEEYSVISVGYTELEKMERRPRLFLRVHPDTPYGQVQELLKTLRKGIPVSIVPWDR